jgi:hypothetical protein
MGDMLETEQKNIYEGGKSNYEHSKISEQFKTVAFPICNFVIHLD